VDLIVHPDDPSDPIRLAIHPEPGSYSERWIECCEQHGIPYKRVDCRRPDVLAQLEGLDGLLWHWRNAIPADISAGPRVIPAVERMGIAVFPSTATCGSYDDKIAQKYLLEAIAAPLAETWIFFDPDSALRWVEQTSFPKVFKLSRGAGSQNVRLVKTAAEARRLIGTAFRRGFDAVPGYLQDVQNKARRHVLSRDLFATFQRLPSTWSRIRAARLAQPREKGYVYFQEFLPGNEYDTRVTVIGERAFAYTRDVRPGDFRASGSGRIKWEPERIDQRCLRIAHDVSRRLGAQSLAFDFIFDPAGEPRIVEISYCYVPGLVQTCPGYWDRELNWHPGQIWPQDAILADFLAEIRRRRGASQRPAPDQRSASGSDPQEDRDCSAH
jgi:glutathione synthase/RimK-type ligase-like ATP-grasp enzyme